MLTGPVLALILGGCSTLCKGPGCQDEYAAARLVVLPWGPDLPATFDPWDTAPTRYQGVDSDGTDWTVTPGPVGTLFIGMPGADRVVRAPLQQGESNVNAELELVGTGSFGKTVLWADFDGDGTRDLAVGAPDYAFAAGAVFVFFGAGTAQRSGVIQAEDADLVIKGTSPSDRVGDRVTLCADLTGDALPEVALGVTWLETPPGSELEIPPLGGGVFLLRSEELAEQRGTVDPGALGPLWHAQLEEPDERGALAGSAVSCRSDLNGDRRADVAIGAPYSGSFGRVYVIEPDANAAELQEDSLPGDGTLFDVASFVLEGTVEDGWFGTSLTTGEFDRLAPADLVVGAPGAHSGQGRVEIFRGLDLASGDALPWRTIRNKGNRSQPDHLGRGLAARDLDGDDAAELLVGAPDWWGGGNAYDSGRLFIWSGASAINWPTSFTVDSADWTLEGTSPFQRVGRDPTVADLDPEGPADLLLTMRSPVPAP